MEFFSEHRRMCKSSSDCTKCQYHGDKCDNAIELLEKTVAAVEKWSQEHPRKTRQSVFLEAFPNVGLDSEGVINILPCRMDTKHYHVDGSGSGCKTAPCVICMQEFWMQEVE